VAPSRGRRARAVAAPTLAMAALALAGCGLGADPVDDDGASVVLAFAGDVHFEGSSAAALEGDLGTAATVLAGADVAVVNLETAVTSGGDRQPKTYAFRAPATAFTVLGRGGVDAVSMANNHGMDFGRAGLVDSLAAARTAKVTVLGAGRTDTEAFAPMRRTVRGVRVSVLAATDVLDSFAIGSWPATAARPGVASAKGEGLARLAGAVRAERSRADVVAVVVHWGVERRVCPTARQRTAARALADAGADVVVGSHAHVLQPQATVGRAVVHYGMGNFVFYARGGAAADSGVLTVTATASGVRSTAWHPAVIRGGRPQLLADAAKADAVREQAARGSAC